MKLLWVASVLLTVVCCRGEISSKVEEIDDKNQTKRSIAQAFSDNPIFYRMFLKGNPMNGAQPAVSLSDNYQQPQVGHRSMYFRTPSVTINADISTSDESHQLQENEINERPDLNEIIAFIKQTNTVSSQETPKILKEGTNLEDSSYPKDFRNSIIVPSETLTVHLDDSAKEKVYVILNKRLLNILQPNQKGKFNVDLQPEINEYSINTPAHIPKNSNNFEDVSPLGNIFGRLIIQAMKSKPSEEAVSNQPGLELTAQVPGDKMASEEWSVNSVSTADDEYQQALRISRSHPNNKDSEVMSRLLGLKLEKALNQKILKDLPA